MKWIPGLPRLWKRCPALALGLSRWTKSVCLLEAVLDHVRRLPGYQRDGIIYTVITSSHQITVTNKRITLIGHTRRNASTAGGNWTFSSACAGWLAVVQNEMALIFSDRADPLKAGAGSGGLVASCVCVLGRYLRLLLGKVGTYWCLVSLWSLW